MKPTISIIIADDHVLVRKGLRQVLESQPDFSVLYEADNGEDAFTAIQKHKPEIVILDIEMPKMDGFDVAKRVQHDEIESSIIFLTMYREEHVFNRAMDAGVKGYVLKENAVNDIVNSIRTVAEGKYYISPSISDFLMRRSNRTVSADDAGIEKLTSSERNILRLLSQMKTSQQMANELFVSVKTINNHRTNICAKLGLSGTHSLLRFALDHKEKLQ